ncbi:MAG: class I SAM-dependent methyltransferase, partial [Armatimonadetes bacterium]|nr:class I SAM-dependent methyltransferase [Armatimonadota bacterium]
MPDLQILKKLYDESYFAKGARTGIGYDHYAPPDAFFAYLFTHLNRRVRSGVILEIGCATGEFLVKLKDAGYEVFGIEISEWATQQAKSKGIEVICGAFEDVYQFVHPESFDAILMIDVLEHTRDPIFFVSIAKTLLKPGGLIMIHTPNYLGTPLRFRKEIILTEGREHCFYFTPQAVKSVVKSAGLKRIQIITRPPGPPYGSLVR